MANRRPRLLRLNGEPQWNLCRRRHNIHLLRNSFHCASQRDWSAIARDLKPVYTAPSEQAAMEAFLTFTETWEQRYPAIIKLWENAWPEFVPFLRFDTEIRTVVCTTDENVNRPATEDGCFRLFLLPSVAACDRGPQPWSRHPMAQLCQAAAC